MVCWFVSHRPLNSTKSLTTVRTISASKRIYFLDVFVTGSYILSVHNWVVSFCTNELQPYILCGRVCVIWGRGWDHLGICFFSRIMNTVNDTQCNISDIRRQNSLLWIQLASAKFHHCFYCLFVARVIGLKSFLMYTYILDRVNKGMTTSTLLYT